MTKPKLNAREQLVAFIIDKGWELDPNSTVRDQSSAEAMREQRRIQNPNVFRKADGQGGFYRAVLDYQSRSDWTTEDTRLRAVSLTQLTADNTRRVIGSKSYNNSVELDPRYADSYRSLSQQVWRITSGILSSVSLKQRAEVLLADPALVLWLAEEKSYQRELEIKAENKRRAEESKARKRPLKVNVGQDEFKSLVSDLENAVWKLRRADGLTDLPAAVAGAVAALAPVVAAASVSIPSPRTVDNAVN